MQHPHFHHGNMSLRLIPMLLASALSLPSLAQEPASKAVIALVGDADRFSIGQEGFCGRRTEIDVTHVKQFRIPADKETFFYIQARMHGAVATYTCEGEYAFIPAAGLLHIIRYSISDNACQLEVFQSEPGAAPVKIAVRREPSQSCLVK